MFFFPVRYALCVCVLYVYICVNICNMHLSMYITRALARDFVAHALELLIDFVGVFVRLLVILQRNAQKKSQNERRRS
jgi:hypothetical protein